MRKGSTHPLRLLLTAVVLSTVTLSACATAPAVQTAEKPGLRARLVTLKDTYVRHGLAGVDAASVALTRFADMLLNGRRDGAVSQSAYLHSKGEDNPAALARLMRSDLISARDAIRAATLAAQHGVTEQDAVLLQDAVGATQTARTTLHEAAEVLNPQLSTQDAAELSQALQDFDGAAESITRLVQNS